MIPDANSNVYQAPIATDCLVVMTVVLWSHKQQSIIRDCHLLQDPYAVTKRQAQGS